MVYGDKTFEWEQGRLLSKVQTGNEEVSLFYDHNGLRTNKIVYNGLETRTESYKYDGNKLVSMRSMKNALDDTYDRKFVFVYNSNGIIGFVLDGDYYYYAKNEFGDIVGIYDKNGYQVAEYFYDAWGNVLVEDGNRNPITDLSHLAHLNPIRYRSYFYDVDLGLYYLQSRYYDSNTCRFINADTLDYLDPESINGLNLYCYCLDNPIMLIDPNGHLGMLASVLIGAAIGFLTAYLSDVVKEFRDGFEWSDFCTFEDNWLKYVGAAFGGAIGGLGSSLWATMLCNGVGNLVETAFAGEISNFNDVITQFAFGAIVGGIGIGISKGITKIFANKRIFGILGDLRHNIKVNKRLAVAGFGHLKIGRDGLKKVYAEMYEGLGYKHLQDVITFGYDFVMGMVV